MRIAISGLSGSGNTTACANVSKELGLTVVNYTYRQLAVDLGTTFEDVRKRAGESTIIDYTLDKILLEKAKEDNIILGSRLACWLIDADLKIWLHAPLKIRAKRIAEREGKDPKETLEYTQKRDKSDILHYKTAYGINILKHDFTDFTINTENLSALQVAHAVVAAAKIIPITRKPLNAVKKIGKILNNAETLEVTTIQ